jgi:putative holliday junction resolvase
MQSQNPSSTILAIDVGEKRVGVALSDAAARLPHPLTTLERRDETPQDLYKLITEHQSRALVVGLPRGLDGQRTAQTTAVEEFAQSLTPPVAVPIFWQDEAVTSRQAEEELVARGKPYKKGDIDALSATYILEDFLRDHPDLEELET